MPWGTPAASLAELKDRILSRCEWQDGPLETPCLIYTGHLHTFGYGQIKYQSKTLKTHRVIWICEHGEIEQGKEICHDCDNPPCNNLLHLRADTHEGNMADASRKGRIWNGDQRGENHNGTHLTNIQVSLIKFFVQQGWNCAQLAERYRVSRQAISLIRYRVNWIHIQPFQPIPGEPLPVPPPLPSIVRLTGQWTLEMKRRGLLKEIGDD